MSDYINLFCKALEIEALAIHEASRKVTKKQIEELVNLYNSLTAIKGQLVICGVGKSGLVAQKLAATFSSLGLPSFFLHPTEALHGDLGRIRPSDAIIYISKSGTTEEIIKLIPYISIKKNMTIGLLGDTNSPIAEKCSLVIDCSVTQEACINNQAPTTSSTLAMAVGDAMAVIYEHYIGLSKENFAVNHPGGFLGKSLRLLVKDLMIERDKCPTLSVESNLRDVILKMTEIPLGICVITNIDNQLEGIIVEGDIKRIINGHSYYPNTLELPTREILNKNPITIESDDLALSALKKMERKDKLISVLPVMNGQTFEGIIRLHDLLQEGFLTETSQTIL